MNLSKDMELIRDRYGDPHEIESDFGELSWNYYVTNQSDELALSVHFSEGRLSSILAIDKGVMSLRFPVMDKVEREAVAKAEELIGQAGQLASEGNKAAAIDALEQAIRTAHRHAQTYYWLGSELIINQDYERAAAVLETGFQNEPRNLAICFQLALANFNLGNKARARELCIYLLSISPSSPWHQKAAEIIHYADQTLAEQEADVRDEGSAASTYTPAAQDLAAAVFRLEAEAEFKAFVQRFGEQLDGKFQDALEAIVNDILVKDDSLKTAQAISWLINNLGIAQRRSGYADAAEKNFNMLLTIGSQKNLATVQLKALGNLGNLYRNRGDLQEAREAFDDADRLARQLDHKEAALSLQLNAALVFWLEGNTAEANKRLSAVHDDAREEGLWHIALRAANNLAWMWVELDDLEQAEHYTDQALNLPGIRQYPEDHQQTIEHLAFIHLLRGDSRRGMEFVQSLVSREARANTMLRVAEMAYKREQYELTLDLLEAALQVNSLVTPEILQLIGAAHRALGQVDQAERYIREALSQIDPADISRRMNVLYQLCQLQLHNNYQLFHRGDEAISSTQANLRLLAKWAHENNDRQMLAAALHAVGYLLIYLALAMKKASLILGEISDWKIYCFDSIDATEGALEIAYQDRDSEGIIIGENQLAMNFIELEEWDEAEAHLKQAHEHASSLPLYKWDRIGGNLSFNFARLYRAKGDVEQALKYYIESIRYAETLRAQAQSESFRISVWFDKQKLYEETITYCVQLGRLSEALYYLESIKGRVFLELLSGHAISAELPENEPASVELERQIRRLKQMIDEQKDDPQDSGLLQRLEQDLDHVYVQLRTFRFATDWHTPEKRISKIANPLAYQDLRQLLVVD